MRLRPVEKGVFAADEKQSSIAKILKRELGQKARDEHTAHPKTKKPKPLRAPAELEQGGFTSRRRQVRRPIPAPGVGAGKK